MPDPVTVMLAATHVPPGPATVAALIVIALAALYWQRLGRADVPRSRRRIRRASLAIMITIAIVVALAAGWIDPRVRPAAYLTAWSLALLLLFALVVTALVDATVTGRLFAEEHRATLIESVARRRGAAAGSSGSEDGEVEPPPAPREDEP